LHATFLLLLWVCGIIVVRIKMYHKEHTVARYIRYQQKADKTYAQVIDAVRVDGKKKNLYITSLGAVIDKEKGIFKSKERGVYTFSLEAGYGEAPREIEILYTEIKTERLILDFGDSFMLDQYLRNCTPFFDLFSDILPNQSDSLFALLFFRLLTDKKAYRYAQSWHEGNYASILYPKARLQSQRISDFLSALGSEEVGRDFFSTYLKELYPNHDGTGILIDSTGLHNAVDMPLTALSNHNGDINFETRLIYVIDRFNGMPLYLRYCPGNVIDVTTLCTTVEELRQLGIMTDFAIVDAGYYSESNVDALYADDIAFISRVGPNRKLFKTLIEQHAQSIRQAQYMVPFGNRIVYMRRFSVDLHGHPGYAYLGVDMDSRNMQEKKVSLQALNDKLPFDDIDKKMGKLGSFVIVSSQEMECKELLPLYYTRTQVEQVFDIAKNNADVVPLRIHGEETLRGHLMLTFLATVLFQRLQKDLLLHTQKKEKINPEGSFFVLRNQKCKVYDELVIPQEPTKKMNDIYKLLKIPTPTSIPYERV